ncbi:MAG: hypothetical protein KF858_12805 [Candidatus Sumerlaeia bacterium]|nr:hypothetical protein [Candidatus Sumerlaeia bacterium]
MRILIRAGGFGVICLVTAPALAFVDSGDSAPGNLDTVPPHVAGLGRPALNQIDVTFSEAMGGSGVTDTDNYAVAGPGAGTLSASPGTVTGGTTIYTLSWGSGQQVFGQLLEVTLSGLIEDLVGNPMAINGSANFASTTAVPVELDLFVVE